MGGKSSAPSAPDPINTATTQYNFNRNAYDTQMAGNTASAQNAFGQNAASARDTYGANKAGALDILGANQASSLGTLAANQASARDAFQRNAINQNGLWGTSTWARDAAGNPVAQNITLNPVMQELVGKQQSNAQGLQNAAGKAMSWLPTSAPQTFDASGVDTGDTAAQKAFAAQKGLLQPGFDRDRSRLTTELTNRGIPVGSEAWNNAMNQMDESQGSQLSNVANQAYGAGLSAQNQFYNQALSTHNQGLTDREVPLSEISQYMQLGGYNQFGVPETQQNPTMQAAQATTPQAATPTMNWAQMVTPQGTMQTPNYEQDAYNSYTAKYKQSQNDQSSLTNGLFGIGKMLFTGGGKSQNSNQSSFPNGLLGMLTGGII